MEQYSLSLKFLEKRRKVRGQILMEALIFIICTLSFLVLIQLFHSLARHEIQKERLSQQKAHKVKKARWLRIKKEERL